MNPRPHTGLGPIAKAPPAGHAAAAAEFLRDEPPRSAGLEHEDNPGKAGPIRHARPSAIRLGPLARQQRLDLIPEFVGNQCVCHGIASMLSAATLCSSARKTVLKQPLNDELRFLIIRSRREHLLSYMLFGIFLFVPLIASCRDETSTSRNGDNSTTRNSVSLDALSIIRAFSDHLMAAESWSVRVVTTHLLVDRKGKEFSSTASYLVSVKNPNKLSYRQTEGHIGVSIWNDGIQVLTRFMPKGQSISSKSPKRACETLHDSVVGAKGVHLVRSCVFMAAILSCSPYESIMSEFSEFVYINQDEDKEDLHHIGMESDELRVECWFSADRNPVLRRIVAFGKGKGSGITIKTEFLDWQFNTGIPDAVFAIPDERDDAVD